MEASLEAHPVEDLSPVAEPIEGHVVEATPPVASVAELVDESSIFENLFDSFNVDGDINELDNMKLEDLEVDGVVSHSFVDHPLEKRGNDVVMA